MIPGLRQPNSNQSRYGTATRMGDLWQLSATDLAALIRSRQASAREAATSALNRLEAVNPAINAGVCACAG